MRNCPLAPVVDGVSGGAICDWELDQGFVIQLDGVVDSLGETSVISLGITFPHLRVSPEKGLFLPLRLFQQVFHSFFRSLVISGGRFCLRSWSFRRFDAIHFFRRILLHPELFLPFPKSAPLPPLFQLNGVIWWCIVIFVVL